MGLGVLGMVMGRFAAHSKMVLAEEVWNFIVDMRQKALQNINPNKRNQVHQQLNILV